MKCCVLLHWDTGCITATDNQHTTHNCVEICQNSTRLLAALIFTWRWNCKPVACLILSQKMLQLDCRRILYSIAFRNANERTQTYSRTRKQCWSRMGSNYQFHKPVFYSPTRVFEILSVERKACTAVCCLSIWVTDLRLLNDIFSISDICVESNEMGSWMKIIWYGFGRRRSQPILTH
jgi:hypothetical protein